MTRYVPIKPYEGKNMPFLEQYRELEPHQAAWHLKKEQENWKKWLDDLKSVEGGE